MQDEINFLKWQCRVRQMAMRDCEGRPDDAIMPTVFIKEKQQEKNIGKIITLLNKKENYSQEAELNHIYLHTNDPQERREKALKLFCATYYQKPNEFSGNLTASFGGNSKIANELLATKKCSLVFNAYNQTFNLPCVVKKCAPDSYEYRVSLAHTRLFNPHVQPDVIIISFVVA